MLDVAVKVSQIDADGDHDCLGEEELLLLDVGDTEVEGVSVTQLVPEGDTLIVTIGVIVAVTETVYVSHADIVGEAVNDDVSVCILDQDGELEEDCDDTDVIVYVVDGVLLGTDGSAECVPV